MDELLSVAKELLEDFDLYGAPVQLQMIAKLRRAVEAAQQSVPQRSDDRHTSAQWMQRIWGILRKEQDCFF